MELFLLLLIAIFVISYRMNSGDNFYKYITSSANNIYQQYAPYSFQMVRQKAKDLGQEYTTKEYFAQVVILEL